jgi:hypothetical protein
MKIKSIISSAITASLLLAAAAYAADPKAAIVGKWSDSEGVETVVYSADGSMTETLAGGDVVKGKYSFPDATHIKVELEGPMAAAGPMVSPIAIKGDTMDVTDGGATMHFTKAK